MSYVFTAQQQAEIDVLVNELNTLIGTTLLAQQNALTTRENDWRTLRQFVEAQASHNLGRLSTDINTETGLSPWDEEQVRRTAINTIINTYSLPLMRLPDILCGNHEVATFVMRDIIRPLIFGTIEEDIATTRADIVTKKDQLLQYYENLTTIDPLI